MSQNLTVLNPHSGTPQHQADQAHLFYDALILPDALYATNAFLQGLSQEQGQVLLRPDMMCILWITRQRPLTHTMPL